LLLPAAWCCTEFIHSKIVPGFLVIVQSLLEAGLEVSAEFCDQPHESGKSTHCGIENGNPLIKFAAGVSIPITVAIVIDPAKVSPKNLLNL
jgi:hypothetical protein